MPSISINFTSRRDFPKNLNFTNSWFSSRTKICIASVVCKSELGTVGLTQDATNLQGAGMDPGHQHNLVF